MCVYLAGEGGRTMCVYLAGEGGREDHVCLPRWGGREGGPCVSTSLGRLTTPTHFIIVEGQARPNISAVDQTNVGVLPGQGLRGKPGT